MRNLGRDSNIAPQNRLQFRTPYVRAQMALLGTISETDVTYFVNRDGAISHTPHSTAGVH